MAGNTRGKLKEHFEGVHRNFDWVIDHINKSMTLIATQLMQQDGFDKVKGNPDKEEQFFMKHPLYQGMKSLGTGVQTLDSLAHSIYSKL